MSSIYIRKALIGTLNDNKQYDIQIEGNRISLIKPSDDNTPIPDKGYLIDGSGKALFPTFCNTHTHAAMSLFRGYGDDMPLEQWLTQKIWPNEANLDDEIVYWGSKLAMLEMIKSGTTCFNDMYFFSDATARAAEEMGVRACLNFTFFDHFNDDSAQQVRRAMENFACKVSERRHSDLVQWGIAPHAVYTVSGPTLRWAKDFAREHGMRYHIHAAETPTEVTNAQRDLGYSPISYLNRLGVLDSDTILAHSLWLDNEEIRMVGEQHCTVVHNPNSNLKLASGHVFKYNELRDAGANVTLGTDGCSSSNNLDMIEATKTMSLLQKGWRQDPTALPASEALQVATANGFKALGLNAGSIEVGLLADIMLVDLDNIAFVPNNNSLSNLIYAAHGDCVDTVICNGQILMVHRYVDGEYDIIKNARRVVKKLITQ